MAVLGALNIPLSVTTGGMTKGFKAARKTLDGFAGAFTSVKAGVAGIVGGLAVGGLSAFVKGQMDAIDVNAKLSDRLGLSTEALSGMQHAADRAGVDSEALAGWLSKLQKSIGEAQDQATPAANAFRAMGLDATALANMPLDQSFTQIAQKISELPNPVDKAQMALALFGKSGQQLLPLLTSGAEGIKAAQKEAERLGISFSRIDAAKVEAANDAMTRAGAAISGIGRQIAVGVSPYIEAVAMKFAELASTGSGLQGSFGPALQFVGEGLAEMADLVDIGAAAFYSLQGVALGAFSGIARGAEMLTNKLIEILPKSVSEKLGLAGASDFADGFAKGLEKDADAAFAKANAAWTAPTRADGVRKFFSDIGASADASAKKIAASASQVGQFDGAFQKAQEAQKEMQDMQNRAKQIFEQTRTPAEKYADTLNELVDLQAAGVLDQETFDRAVAAADQAAGIGEGVNRDVSGVSGKQKGSAEAFSSIQASIREGANDPARKTAANTQTIATNSTRQTEYLRTMAQNSPEVVEDF